MSRQSEPESAKVIPFPQKASAALRGPRRPSTPPARPAATRNPDIEWGSGWYHQVAIRDDEKPAKT